MALLDTNKLQEQVAFIKQDSQRLYSYICISLDRAFNLVWNNPDYTPQQVLDQFGSDAYELFIYSSKMQDVLLEIRPEYEYKTPPYEYTINADGTVTVGALKEDNNPSDVIDNPSDSSYLFGM